MSTRSHMAHSFSDIPSINIPRSKFNRSHRYKTTFDSGYLVPCFFDEALPGDTKHLHMQCFARLATPVVPFMDNLWLDSFFFAVPIRLIWENWERFNGAQDDPGDSTDFLTPQVVAPAVGGFTTNSLYDYFAFPTGIGNLSVLAFYTRAYNLIWREWFRSENLQDSPVVDRDDGPDDPADYFLRRRGKRFDYFTSALPEPQKGPAVELPLGTSAPVVRVAGADAWTTFQAGTNTRPGATATLETVITSGIVRSTSGSPEFSFDPEGGLEADLSTATAATINAFRQALQVQALYERDNVGGTRYTEINYAHFGVISPDARLQRPEYLGGGSTRINVHPVAQTSSTDATTPQGNLAAFGVVNASHNGFVRSFTEHCVVIGLVSVRADLTYQQGLDRSYSRRTRFDYYWPSLANIGEQAILNKEIYTQGPAAINPGTGVAYDNEVFGYIPRYDEYRFKPSYITGTFRSAAAQTLDVWHLAQDFGALPVLDDEFIQENPPVDRVVVVDDEPEFLGDFYFTYLDVRPIPVRGTPASFRL